MITLLTYSRQVAIYKLKIPILKYPRHKSYYYHHYHHRHIIYVMISSVVTTTNTNTTIIILTLINIFHTN